MSRPARGAWIETTIARECRCRIRSRAPHGARGLKLSGGQWYDRQYRSRPARGAWIETVPLSGSIETGWGSRPARGAWIETRNLLRSGRLLDVAPRTGRVD